MGVFPDDVCLKCELNFRLAEFNRNDYPQFLHP